MLRCLLVDDSPRFLAAARGLLERQGVAVVGVASSGIEALGKVEELRPDVVLLDIGLGEQSGFDVAEQLQRDRRLPPSRIILISTRAEQDYADLIADSPAIGFVTKANLSATAIRDLLHADGPNTVDPVSGPEEGEHARTGNDGRPRRRPRPRRASPPVYRDDAVGDADPAEAQG